MTYKTILAHFNDEQRFDGLMRISAQLAKAHGAYLTGMGIMPPIIIVPGADASGPAVIEEHRIEYKPHLAHMRDGFAAGLKQAGLQGEWLELDCDSETPLGDVGAVAVQQARLADLVIASTVNPSWSLSGYLDVPEAMIMNSGRPVLVLPNPPVPETLGRHVLLAWNDSREAVRAAADAMPFLMAAESVLVTQIGETKDRGEVHPASAANMCAMLARHGVKAKPLEAKQGSRNIGAALLDAAQSHGCDLMVMGCYGHSRFRELVLGGASRQTLQNVHIPVLMSH